MVKRKMAFMHTLNTWYVRYSPGRKEVQEAVLDFNNKKNNGKRIGLAHW